MSVTDTRRKHLNATLKAMPTDALEAIKAGLESEPYICVGTWVNNNVCEITNKSVGCLLAAAYMHTELFDEELRERGEVHRVMGDFDSNPEDYLRDAFGLEWHPETDPIEDLVNAFDSWANSSDSLHEFVTYGKSSYDGEPYSQNVLTKRAQNALIRTIDKLIAERS